MTANCYCSSLFFQVVVKLWSKIYFSREVIYFWWEMRKLAACWERSDVDGLRRVTWLKEGENQESGVVLWVTLPSRPWWSWWWQRVFFLLLPDNEQKHVRYVLAALLLLLPPLYIYTQYIYITFLYIKYCGSRAVTRKKTEGGWLSFKKKL